MLRYAAAGRPTACCHLISIYPAKLPRKIRDGGSSGTEISVAVTSPIETESATTSQALFSLGKDEYLACR